MAWNKVTAPTGGAPLTTADYNAQNQHIIGALGLAGRPIKLLTEWATLTVPEIADGVYWIHGGSLYLNSGALAITNPGVVNGRVYISISDPGTGVLAAALTNSAAGYTWNDSKQGFYNGAGAQLLPIIMYKTASGYYKFTLEKSENKFDITASVKYESIGNSLGFWDMTISSSVTVSSDVLTTLYNTVGITETIKRFNAYAIIIDDTNVAMHSLFYNGAFYLSNPGGLISVVFRRLDAGLFNSAFYDDATMIRGYYSLQILI